MLVASMLHCILAIFTQLRYVWPVGQLYESRCIVYLCVPETGFSDQYLTFLRAFERFKRLTHFRSVTELEWPYNLSNNSRLWKAAF